MKVIGAVIAAVICVSLGIIAGATLVEEKQVPPTYTATIGTNEIELDADNNYESADTKEAADPTPEDLAIHEDLRDETPPGLPSDVAERIIEDDPKGISEPVPVGGAQIYSCPNRYVRNFSDRASGSKVGLFVLHYAVIRPVPNALDIIRALFDRPSFGASSHLGLHPNGKCETWVPFNKKAWTQGAFNSVSESVEIMMYGNETRSYWLAQPIIKNEILAAIVVDRLRARGLPPRRVDPVGCGVQFAGWTDHNSLECGNTHHDVAPNFPYDVFAQQVIRRYRAGQGPPPLPGPRPKPGWFWTWCNWVLDNREDTRPEEAPLPIPDWGWDACDEWARRH